jgi:nitroreductase
MYDPPPRHVGKPAASIGRSMTVARLARFPRLCVQSAVGQAVVRSIRVLAVSSRLGHDPLPDLVQHFRSFEAAQNFIAFADRLGTCWPERVTVLRPCCSLLSPDEVTIAAIAALAMAGNRDGFSRELAGLVRADRHDCLFDLAVRMVASMQAGGLPDEDYGSWR